MHVDLRQSQLFIDDTWIEDTFRLGRQLHQPRKYIEPILKPDRPWEQSAILLWGSVLYDPISRRFQIWYVTWLRMQISQALPYDHPGWSVCYAESADGIHWEKPNLGLYPFAGSKANNIVWQMQREIDGVTVVPPSGDDSQYTMIFWTRGDPPVRTAWEGTNSGLWTAKSRDGIHWELAEPHPVVSGVGDRTTVVSDRAGFAAFTRTAKSWQRYPVRTVNRLESQDAIHWSEPELILKPDLLDGADMEFYGMVAFPYECVYLGLLERMHRIPDVVDTELVISHDSRAWQRIAPRSAFLPLGSNGQWDCAWVTIAQNPPIRLDNRLWFYYSGRSGTHGSPYPHNAGAVGLATLRRDGFASLEAGQDTGWIKTKPIHWLGGDLLVNADAVRSPDGYHQLYGGCIRAEIRDTQGNVIPGYELECSLPLLDDSLSALDGFTALRWENGVSLNALASRDIQIIFSLQAARLYAFRSDADSQKN